MVKPISLRLHTAEILAKARATLIRAGRGDELKRTHTPLPSKRPSYRIAEQRDEVAAGAHSSTSSARAICRQK